jgi:pimeloyl-ACP methyl ester carboxylesterase
MPEYQDKYFRTRDGLDLHYRDYAGGPDQLPVLCLHALTRNCRDFDQLASRLAPGRRVIVPDQRGRGESQYDPHWLRYHPGTHVDDMWACCASCPSSGWSWSEPRSVA